MAHNLNYNNNTGKHSFFSVNKVAWHGLGTIVKEYPNSSEALKFAGLDFTVEKRPIYTLSKEDTSINIKSHFSTVRTDTEQVLGVVGKDYHVVQNVDAFSFFDSIVGGDGIMYETAGALGDGERIFITAKLPGYISVGKDDDIERYLFLTTSHDGFGSITAAFTPIRIVCQNTLHAALNNCNNAVKIRHTANAKERLEQAHKVMGISNNLSTQLEEVFNRWSKISINDNAVKKLIQLAMVPSKEVLENVLAGREDSTSAIFRKICDNAFEYSQVNPSQLMNSTKGTLFGAYNAVTGYFQNVRTYKSDEIKMKSLFYGGIAQTRSQKAFSLCTDFEKQGDRMFLLN